MPFGSTDSTKTTISEHIKNVFKEGEYSYILIQDYMKDIPAIGKAFEKLTANPGIDPNGYCIEWYLTDKGVKCMVKLK